MDLNWCDGLRVACGVFILLLCLLWCCRCQGVTDPYGDKVVNVENLSAPGLRHTSENVFLFST